MYFSADVNLNLQYHYASEENMTTPLIYQGGQDSHEDLMRAPLRKKATENNRLRFKKDDSTVRKKLNFDSLEAIECERKGSKSLSMSALHNNDLAVPFSELDFVAVCSRVAKRVKHDDEIEKSPAPETPIYDSCFRNNSETAKFNCNSTSFTDICDPAGKRKINIDNLFNTTGDVFQCNTMNREIMTSRNPIRNLTAMWT